MAELTMNFSESNKDKIQIMDSAFEAEWLWLKAIQSGLLTKSSDVRREAMIHDLTMAPGDEDNEINLNRVKYAMVAGITLACRAAIWGGVPAQETTDHTTDLLIRVANSQSIRDVEETAGDFDIEFSDMVAARKKTGKKSVNLYKDYIAEHLYKQFTVQQMADDLGVNRSHMTRTFTKETGMNIAEYVRYERLKNAARLLRESDTPIALIAEHLHFSSASQFSVYFRQRYGSTPTEYRRRMQL